MAMNGHISKLFKNIFMMFKPRATGGDKYGLTLLLKKLHFNTISIEGLKLSYFVNSTAVFNHQRL